MNVLAIDVGAKAAWAFENETGKLTFKTLWTFMSEVEQLVYDHEPDLLVSCRPTRFPQVIAAHSKYLAIIELVCEIHNIQYYEGIDSQMKKAVLLNGHAKKPDIIKWAKVESGNKKISEDEADALMFTRGVLKLIECEKSSKKSS